jgi:acetylglutamate kinase
MIDNPYEFLRGATPYIARFRGKTFVVKLGGELLSESTLLDHVCDQLALLHHLSIPLVIVHGAGPQIEERCRQMGIPTERVAGRRVTTPEVLDVAKMVFAGSVHTDFLARLRAAGLPCVGLTGVDAGLVTARRRPPVKVVPDDGGPAQLVDYGLVGDIESLDPWVVVHLLQGGFVPVIAPLTGGAHGEVFNTNADTIAAALAGAMGAEKLFFLVRVAGLLHDEADPTTIVSYVTGDELVTLEQQGVVTGGMRPKCRAARDALQRGVRSVHIVSGVKPDALLREVFTNEGSGTMIVPRAEDGV